MKKRTEHGLKSEKRAIKKRPRMKVHGTALKRPSKHAGFSIAKVKQ